MKIFEKIGYGFGDMSSSMFWKLFSYFLPFFYSNVFGLSLADAGVLMLVTRIWDAVSDPMMGIIADRTKTRWGKYRPYLLFFALPFAVCGVLLFTTPENGKTLWAYITYILMMTVYTGINVPYGSLLNVMTADSDEKSVLSSYRMFFAYGGSFIALFAWEPLCNMFDKARSVAEDSAGGLASISTSPEAWQKAMIVIASCCFILFVLSFLLTKEHVKSESTVSVGQDLKLLLKNKPWWLLIGAALASNLFNTVRGTTTAYFFADYIQKTVEMAPQWAFLVSAGIFLSIGEIANMVGVVLAVPMSKHLGKKSTYIISMAVLIGLSIAFFFLPATPGGYWSMLVFQVVISIFTGVISPLVWSMYADVADYSELKDGTASTGLIFSSASMAQKFGGAFGGSAVMWMLAAFGYNTVAGAVQTETAILGLRILMSWVPAAVAALSILVVWFYPLTKKKMEGVQAELAVKRGAQSAE
ncbi:MAG: MFS transporter [Bacteroidales bacterium]|nr:MFS transporter [Bacteroidales bacterium]